MHDRDRLRPRRANGAQACETVRRTLRRREDDRASVYARGERGKLCAREVAVRADVDRTALPCRAGGDEVLGARRQLADDALARLDPECAVRARQRLDLLPQLAVAERPCAVRNRRTRRPARTCCGDRCSE